MKKYYVYAGNFDDVPDGTKYIHYESGNKRTLIFVSKRPSAEKWTKLDANEISKLSPFERQWFGKCRNEVNTEYVKSPAYQREALRKYNVILDKYAELLEQAKVEKDRNNAETTC